MSEVCVSVAVVLVGVPVATVLGTIAGAAIAKLWLCALNALGLEDKFLGWWGRNVR